MDNLRGDTLFPADSKDKIALGRNPSYVDTWQAMEKLVRKGKVKALGVSNFNQKEIKDIMDQCDTVIISLYWYWSSTDCKIGPCCTSNGTSS